MAFFGKTYKFVEDTNREEFLKTLDIPEEASALLFNTKPDVRIDKDGDQYSLVLISSKGEKAFVFQPGVESDLTLGPISLKQKITINDNTVVQEMRTESGKVITAKKVFSGDDLLSTYTSNKWDGTASIRYKIA